MYTYVLCIQSTYKTIVKEHRAATNALKLWRRLLYNREFQTTFCIFVGNTHKQAALYISHRAYFYMTMYIQYIHTGPNTIIARFAVSLWNRPTTPTFFKLLGARFREIVTGTLFNPLLHSILCRVGQISIDPDRWQPAKPSQTSKLECLCIRCKQSSYQVALS